MQNQQYNMLKNFQATCYERVTSKDFVHLACTCKRIVNNRIFLNCAKCMAKLEDLSCLKTLKYIQLRNLDTCIKTVKLSFVNLGWQSLTSVMSTFICMLAVLGGSPLSMAIITSSWAESCQPIMEIITAIQSFY